MRSLFPRCLFVSTVTLVAACEGGSVPYDSVENGGSASVDVDSGGAGNSGGSSSRPSTTVPPFSAEGCTVAPVNANATEQAKKLLCYLYSINGKNVLSGQQETSWKDGGVDIEWIKTQTGKYPAVLGGDYLYPGDKGKNGDGTTERAQAFWKAGGIPLIRYHMGAPPNEDTYEFSKFSVANLDDVVKSDTPENTSFNAKLDYVAKHLLILERAGVAVLWAPFHEVQANGWFWWSKGSGAQFVALWKYAYEYLTNTKEVNNLIWLLPFSGNVNAAYYPGKEYVDIAGPDTYAPDGQPFAGLYRSTRSVVGTTMPIALHETGKIPNPDEMFPSAAPWVLFNVWCGFENDSSENSVAEIQSAYASSYTLTRDEVPSLK